MSREIFINRETKETQIKMTLNMSGTGNIEINTPLPFFSHMLHAMSFHGRFDFKLEAYGDIEVDPHHLVEDTGLVLGLALSQTLENFGAVHRYSHAYIPMDEALSRIVIDVSGRPYCRYSVDYPQAFSGLFPMETLREFFLGLSQQAKISLHADCLHGENAHHMSESLFKALGIALKAAYTSKNEHKDNTSLMSTKGYL